MDDTKGNTIQSLPAEIRMIIWDCLLNMTYTPRSFGYTQPYLDGPRRKRVGEKPPPLRTHAIILVSHKFSAEYRQAYYERTTFFLRVDSSNAFRTLPQLAFNPSTSLPGSSPSPSSLPNFWNAPEALLSSLRHCTVYVEIGDIACAPPSVHSAAGAVRAISCPSDGRRALMNYSSFEELKAADAPFDSTLVSAVLAILTSMQQLRSVRVVWDTSTPLRISPRLTPTRTANWTWDVLGKPVADLLRTRGGTGGNLRGWFVRVGDRYADNETDAKRGDDGKWTEKSTTSCTRG